MFRMRTEITTLLLIIRQKFIIYLYYFSYTVFFYPFFFAVLRLGLRAWCLLGRPSATEPGPRSFLL
jgi:hypothetical protein